MKSADPIEARSEGASKKGRIDSRIQCRQCYREKDLAQGASIDSLHEGYDEPETLRSAICLNCPMGADVGQFCVGRKAGIVNLALLHHISKILVNLGWFPKANRYRR